MIGLPGGSSDEGPATTFGVILLVIAAAIFVAVLLGLLFYVAEWIEHPPPDERHQRLVESFALSDNVRDGRRPAPLVPREAADA